MGSRGMDFMVAAQVLLALGALLHTAAAGCANADTHTEHVLVQSVDAQHTAVSFVASALGRLQASAQRFPAPIAALFDTYPLQSFDLTLTRGRWRQAWCA